MGHQSHLVSLRKYCNDWATVDESIHPRVPNHPMLSSYSLRYLSMCDVQSCSIIRLCLLIRDDVIPILDEVPGVEACTTVVVARALESLP